MCIRDSVRPEPAVTPVISPVLVVYPKLVILSFTAAAVINTVSESLNDSEPVCIAASPKSLTAKSGSLALANVPEPILLAFVVSVVAELAKPLTAPLAIAISVEPAAVN